jgi:hypothetical protein
MSEALAMNRESIWLPVDIRSLCLMAAIIIYGFAGTPTPDTLGITELFVGFLLLAAAGGWQVAALMWQREAALWQKAAKALLIYGLSAPVLGGMINGHDIGLIIRDIIPFLFLTLPFFLMPPGRDYTGYVQPLTATIAMAGILFALRVLMPVLKWRSGFSFEMDAVNDPGYLVNAPTVLFSALLLLGLAGYSLYKGAGFGNVAHAVLMAGLALVPLAAMALIVQRANIGLTVAVPLLLGVVGLVKSPGRMVLPLLALGLVLWTGHDAILDVAQSAEQKSALVGLNMRWNEAMAVFDRVSRSVPSVLFGQGWGATVASPAVGGLTVNFTHSLLTTYFLKTGLCGLALVLCYLGSLAAGLVPLLFRFPVLALAVAGPFLIDVSLYASFKSLDFGLLLFLIPLWATGPDLLRKRHAYSTA